VSVELTFVGHAVGNLLGKVLERVIGLLEGRLDGEEGTLRRLLVGRDIGNLLLCDELAG
jgi:hypothetical protein